MSGSDTDGSLPLHQSGQASPVQDPTTPSIDRQEEPTMDDAEAAPAVDGSDGSADQVTATLQHLDLSPTQTASNETAADIASNPVSQTPPSDEPPPYIFTQRTSSIRSSNDTSPQNDAAGASADDAATGADAGADAGAGAGAQEPPAPLPESSAPVTTRRGTLRSSVSSRSVTTARGDDASQPSLAQRSLRRNTSYESQRRRTQDVALPRWQSDAEVTYCPICKTQFSFFVRKHHCRKCGRVVCNACSPHRIIIPHQYIVRPPGADVNVGLHPTLFVDGLGTGYMDASGISGGERVRLCNPCVPDPNVAPPHSPALEQGSGRMSHRRARSSISGIAPSTNARLHDPDHSDSSSGDHWPRSRSITMGPYAQIGANESSRDAMRASSSYHQTAPERFIIAAQRQAAEASSSRRRPLPPPPQIAEEDECPICHRELPSRELPEFETLREQHITGCIVEHSRYGSPRNATATTNDSSPAPVAPRRSGMYTYKATEKDCVDDAECTICLEEFEAGVGMARLECLCRFHYKCISLWFVNHPGRCPVHQHDGFGY